jgi:hypothetical protein
MSHAARPEHALTLDRRQPDAGSAAPRRAADRATRFIARVDAHLATLADHAARRTFLDRQLEGWERRYARFMATEGESEPTADPTDPPQAADFLLTITALAARRDAFNATGEAIMPDGNADTSIDRALRSLLVAADQRCPAIIGQAHLLYYRRSGASPEDAMEAFTQLKREADDLCKAVADVEAAMSTNAADRVRGIAG